MNCPICGCYRNDNVKGFYLNIEGKKWTLCRHCYNELYPVTSILFTEKIICRGWTLWDEQDRYLEGVRNLNFEPRQAKDVKFEEVKA